MTVPFSGYALPMRTLITLLLLLLSGLAAQAQTTRYVSDELELPLRAGTSTRYKILEMLPSGTPVEVLNTDADSGYSQVSTDDGTRGWLLTRFLMDEPSARERLNQALQALEPLQAENARLQEELDALTADKTNAETDYQILREENQRLSQELAQIRKTAANAMVIDEQNKTLQERMVNLERELQITQQENQALADRSAKDWFLAGAGVLLLGVILGTIIPRLRWQKRDRWREL